MKKEVFFLAGIFFILLCEFRFEKIQKIGKIRAYFVEQNTWKWTNFWQEIHSVPSLSLDENRNGLIPNDVI